MAPQKGNVMDEDDFNNMINQGTKVLKLSSLNLKTEAKIKPKVSQREELGDVIESRNNIKTQVVTDSSSDKAQISPNLRTTNGQIVDPPGSEKKGTFGKLFGSKKLKTKISDQKLDVKLKPSKENLIISPRESSNSPRSPAYSDSSTRSQVTRNTNHNAGFIEVERLVVDKKSTGKGVTFRDAVSEISSIRSRDSLSTDLDTYYDSYGNAQRPAFTNRGSSLKNLEQQTGKQIITRDIRAAPIPGLIPITETAPPLPHRMESLPRGASLGKAATLERKLPPTPTIASTAFQKPSINSNDDVFEQNYANKGPKSADATRHEEHEEIEFEPYHFPRHQRSADLHINSKPKNDGLATSKSAHDLTVENKKSMEKSRQNSDSNKIDQADSRKKAKAKSSAAPESAAISEARIFDLLDEVEELKAHVQDVEAENRMFRQQLEDQKKGFDKLSAQAYKKIKGLLTERNIMSIEAESLKSQVILD